MFQTSVTRVQALGSAGDLANTQGGLNVISLKVADANIYAGGFVVAGANEGEAAGVVAANVATGKILGIALKSEFIESSAQGTNFPIGSVVAVVTSGNVLTSTSAVCKTGQYVFLKNADATLVFGDAATLADHTNTGWRVVRGNATAGASVIEITTAL